MPNEHTQGDEEDERTMVPTSTECMPTGGRDGLSPGSRWQAQLSGGQRPCAGSRPRALSLPWAGRVRSRTRRPLWPRSPGGGPASKSNPEVRSPEEQDERRRDRRPGALSEGILRNQGDEVQRQQGKSMLTHQLGGAVEKEDTEDEGEEGDRGE